MRRRDWLQKRGAPGSRSSPSGLGERPSARGAQFEDSEAFDGRIVRLEWAAQHREELIQDWQLARAQAPLKAIPPLE